jgi:hypothetical protein
MQTFLALTAMVFAILVIAKSLFMVRGISFPKDRRG